MNTNTTDQSHRKSVSAQLKRQISLQKKLEELDDFFAEKNQRESRVLLSKFSEKLGEVIMNVSLTGEQKIQEKNNLIEKLDLDLSGVISKNRQLFRTKAGIVINKMVLNLYKAEAKNSEELFMAGCYELGAEHQEKAEQLAVSAIDLCKFQNEVREFGSTKNLVSKYQGISDEIYPGLGLNISKLSQN
jgi:putative aminopeptidase FrvX